MRFPHNMPRIAIALMWESPTLPNDIPPMMVGRRCQCQASCMHGRGTVRLTMSTPQAMVVVVIGGEHLTIFRGMHVDPQQRLSKSINLRTIGDAPVSVIGRYIDEMTHPWVWAAVNFFIHTNEFYGYVLIFTLLVSHGGIVIIVSEGWNYTYVIRTFL